MRNPSVGKLFLDIGRRSPLTIGTLGEVPDGRFDTDREWHLAAHASARRSMAGEADSASYRLCVPGGIPAHLRQARAGAAQSIRPGGPALAFQHRAERDHRRRQLGRGGPGRRLYAAGGELSRGAVYVPAPPLG